MMEAVVEMKHRVWSLFQDHYLLSIILTILNRECDRRSSSLVL